MGVRLVQPTPSAYSFPLLIKNLIQPAQIYFPDQEIVFRDQHRYTYRDFFTRVHRLANMLESQGVKQGDVVAVMDWDSHRYLECFFGVPMMGAVLHTVNIRLSPEQLLYTINHAQDDVILVNAEFLPLLEPIKDQLETVKKIIVINDQPESPQTGLNLAGDYDQLVDQAPAEYEFPDFDENAMATLFYTTGTTGLPKGVNFSHRQLVLHTYGILSALGTFPGFKVDIQDVYMPLTPMFHVHAWGMPYFATMMGLRQVYPGRYDPEMILKLITGEGVTFSHCVPTILHMLVTSEAIKSLDLSKWKVVIGGSALPKGLCKAALKHGINVTTAYGMSETCPVLTAALLKPNMWDLSEEEQVTVRCRTGLPIPNVRLEVVDPMGFPQPHDGKSTGEVVVRSPWLTQSYLNDPEKSEALWQDGWMHTGDVGYIDTEGYLQITDRVKDVIKTGGEWISSLELEDIISQHEAVSEAAVIAVPDEKWGERPAAMVVLRPEYRDQIGEEDLRAFYQSFVDKGSLPKYGVPGRIDIVDSIPKTSVGKISKKDIRKMYQ
ncbi:fatty acid--CoA ligase [Desulfovermiculus halophilus]|jgi:fatty-acyl-CoA synthase|uniref:fatty acid--CoA ligase n=1 Tax=Desulfovermiculus halophilus TaxID=339722 RepID=UPI00048197C4|nr:fatty acid--CoA ligase [Desulfovermiculus halophilus]